MADLRGGTLSPWLAWLRRQLSLDYTTQLYALSVVVGVLAGLGAVAFTYGLQLVTYVCMELLAGQPLVQYAGVASLGIPYLGPPPAAPRRWLLVLLPAAGGLVSGYLAHRFAPEAEGPGGDAMIDAFHNRRGRIRPVVPLVKAVSTIVTLGSGGSAGKEGPLLHIGGGLGSWLADRLGLSTEQRRILLLAGTAGGLGAIFRAPLGGAITSVEVLYREDFEADALIPCVISSIVAYSVHLGVYGFTRIFTIPAFHFHDVRELALYTLLGGVCALTGIAYMRVFYFLRDRLFRRLPLPRVLTVGLGGLLVGLLALIDPRTLGTGFGTIQQTIDGQLAVGALLLLTVLKIVSSSCTIGAGGSGGFFGPSLFIGAMLGGAVGALGQQHFPGVVQEPAAYAVVGMASFFGAVANTPLAALIIVTEMSGSYHLLPPLMLVGAITLILARNASIYEKQVRSKFHSPAHVRDLTVDVLEHLRVASLLPQLRRGGPAVVRNDTSWAELRRLSLQYGHQHFVVVDGQRELHGMLTMEDLDVADTDLPPQLVLVEDMLIADVVPVLDTDDLHVALHKLLESGFDKLPVTRETDGEQELVAYVTHQDLLRAYHDEVERVRQHG